VAGGQGGRLGLEGGSGLGTRRVAQRLAAWLIVSRMERSQVVRLV
jgi:hypothetical protein